MPVQCVMSCPPLTEDTCQDLLASFAAVHDPRHRRGIRHTVQVILAIAAVAVICGARSFAAIGEWARDAPQRVLEVVGARWHRLRGRFVAPHEATLRRTIQAFNAQLLDGVICGWIAEQEESKPVGSRSAIAVDGKVVRGAWRPDGSQVNLLSAISHDTAIVLAQREIAAKTNEIPELSTLLADLDLTGVVVSADALHTQRETARHLVADRGAHYVLGRVRGLSKRGARLPTAGSYPVAHLEVGRPTRTASFHCGIDSCRANRGLCSAAGSQTGHRSSYGHGGLSPMYPVIVPLPGRRTVRTTHRTPRTMGFICYAPLSKRNLGEVIMSDITGFWADLQERLTGDPEFARQYLLECVKVSTVDRIVNELDARRQDLGLSKSDLAKAVRLDPAAIRRLLSDSTGNPTLETVSSVAAAVGLRVALVPMGNAERQVLSDPLRELVDR